MKEACGRPQYFPLPGHAGGRKSSTFAEMSHTASNALAWEARLDSSHLPGLSSSSFQSESMGDPLGSENGALVLVPAG